MPAIEPSATPEAMLGEARAAAAAGDCATARAKIDAAADAQGFGPALVAKGEGFDPLHAEHRCLVNSSRWDIVLALKYYGQACEARVSGAAERVAALAAWVERESASDVADSRVVDSVPALRGAKRKCGL